MSLILTHDRMKNPIFSEDFNFFDISPRAKCVLLLFYIPWFPPSKAPLKIGRSWVQFLLMTEWKKSNFSRRFQLFPHLTESKISWCFPSSPSPRDPCRRECHGLNSYDQPKKPLSRYFFFNYNRGESVADALGTLPRPRGPRYIYSRRINNANTQNQQRWNLIWKTLT